jgi:hypothetical protein
MRNGPRKYSRSHATTFETLCPCEPRRNLPKTVACRHGKQAVKNLPVYQIRQYSNLARTLDNPRESEEALEQLGRNCGSQEVVSRVVAGAKRMDQLEGNLRAVDVSLD